MVRGVRTSLGAGLLALLVVLVAACGGGGGAATVDAEPVEPDITVPPETIDATLAPEPGVLRLGLNATPGSAVLRFGAREGWFADEGLSLRLAEERDATAIEDALAAGALDGAAVDTEVAIAMRARGVKVRVILLLDQSTTADVILGVPGIDDPSGLAGRRVAYVPGSRGELLLRAALADVGSDPDAIEPVAVVGEEPAALLERGEVDAAAVSEPEASRLLEPTASDAPEIGLVFASGDVPGVLAEVLVVREEVIAERPGQLLALVRGWSATIGMMRDLDEETVDATLVRLIASGGDDGLARLAGTFFYDVEASAVELLPGGRYYDVTVDRASTIAIATGAIREPVAPDAVLDGGFARAVASGAG